MWISPASSLDPHHTKKEKAPFHSIISFTYTLFPQMLSGAYRILFSLCLNDAL